MSCRRFLYLLRACVAFYARSAFHYRTIYTFRGYLRSYGLLFLGVSTSFIYSTRILRFQLIHFHLSPTLRASYTSIDSR
nr:MAG TPA: hypothetical protein [Crassvirales sp.]